VALGAGLPARAAVGLQPPPGAYRVEPGSVFVETPDGRGEHTSLPQAGPSRWCVDASETAWPPFPMIAGPAPDERWQRLDATHWLRTLVRRPPAGLPPGPGGAALARALEADIAALQARIRTGAPGQAAEARGELAALRERVHAGAGAGAGVGVGVGVGTPLVDNPSRSPPPRLEVRERWIRLAERCDAAPLP
jgi:hypothetical protein